MCWYCGEKRGLFSYPRQVRVTQFFSKEYRTISLSSFFLKKFWQMFLPLNQRHPVARHLGKSTEALEYKEYALGVFLDIFGTFNNASSEAIMNIIESIGVEPATSLWIKSFLGVERCKGNQSGMQKRTAKWCYLTTIMSTNGQQITKGIRGESTQTSGVFRRHSLNGNREVPRHSQ